MKLGVTVLCNEEAGNDGAADGCGFDEVDGPVEEALDEGAPVAAAVEVGVFTRR